MDTGAPRQDWRGGGVVEMPTLCNCYALTHPPPAGGGTPHGGGGMLPLSNNGGYLLISSARVVATPAPVRKPAHGVGAKKPQAVFLGWNLPAANSKNRRAIFVRG